MSLQNFVPCSKIKLGRLCSVISDVGWFRIIRQKSQILIFISSLLAIFSSLFLSFDLCNKLIITAEFINLLIDLD